MVKVDTITISGRTIPLAFDVAALLEVEEKHGSMDGLMDAIKAEEHAAAKRVELVMLLAERGEKHAPTGTPVTREWLKDYASPHDLGVLLAAAIKNASRNLSGEKSPGKDKPIDVTLQEIESKNAPGG